MQCFSYRNVPRHLAMTFDAARSSSSNGYATDDKKNVIT